MENLGKKLCFLLGICLIFSACKANTPKKSAMPDLVTSVSVSYEHRDMHLTRIYTDNAKMDVILFYLYSLSPYGRADEDPETLVGDRCRITVTLSHGDTHIYRQFGDQYLSIDNRPWQKISEDQASVLFHLVNHIESDE